MHQSVLWLFVREKVCHFTLLQYFNYVFVFHFPFRNSRKKKNRSFEIRYFKNTVSCRLSHSGLGRYTAAALNLRERINFCRIKFGLKRLCCKRTKNSSINTPVPVPVPVQNAASWTAWRGLPKLMPPPNF
jgi:hypothetical protein